MFSRRFLAVPTLLIALAARAEEASKPAADEASKKEEGLFPDEGQRGEAQSQRLLRRLHEDGAQGRRPITFAFNGGHGSSLVWLHLRALGPKRVALTDEGQALPPPYIAWTTRRRGSASATSCSSIPSLRDTAVPPEARAIPRAQGGHRVGGRLHLPLHDTGPPLAVSPTPPGGPNDPGRGSNGRFMCGRSCEALASGFLAGEQERLDELTLATD